MRKITLQIVFFIGVITFMSACCGNGNRAVKPANNFKMAAACQLTKLTQIIGPNSLEYTFQYDRQGRLISFTVDNKKYQVEYNVSNKISRLINTYDVNKQVYDVNNNKFVSKSYTLVDKYDASYTSVGTYILATKQEAPVSLSDGIKSTTSSYRMDVDNSGKVTKKYIQNILINAYTYNSSEDVKLVYKYLGSNNPELIYNYTKHDSNNNPFYEDKYLKNLVQVFQIGQEGTLLGKHNPTNYFNTFTTSDTNGDTGSGNTGSGNTGGTDGSGSEKPVDDGSSKITYSYNSNDYPTSIEYESGIRYLLDYDCQ